jgi:hypothetical protein
VKRISLLAVCFLFVVVRRLIVIAAVLVSASALAQPQVLPELHATSALLAELGRIASSQAQAPKVRQLGDRVWHDFDLLADATGDAPPDPADIATAEQLATLEGADFDEAFLDALQSRCLALRSDLGDGQSSGDPRYDALLELGRRRTTLYANDARRVRGEYVPLADDGR